MSRHRDRPRDLEKGRFSDSRTAWTRVNVTEVVIYEQYNELQYPDGTPLLEIILSLRSGGRYPMNVNLSALTREELTMFRQIVDHAIDKAAPTCEALDETARKAFEEHDDDSYIRLYRPVPQFHVRERPALKHNSGVPIGPDRTTGVDGEPATEPDRDDGGDVPQHPSGGVGADNDEA